MTWGLVSFYFNVQAAMRTSFAAKYLIMVFLIDSANDINFERMGKYSMELLLSMLNGEKITGIIHVPTRLIIRQSSSR